MSLVSFGLLPPFYTPIALTLGIIDVVKGVVILVKSINDKKGEKMDVNTQSCESIDSIDNKKQYAWNILKKSWNLRWRCIPTRTLT